MVLESQKSSQTETTRDHSAPQTTSELVKSVTAAIQTDLVSSPIRELLVEVDQDGVKLRGKCGSYYRKQRAQHAAMTVSGWKPLQNLIEVT